MVRCNAAVNVLVFTTSKWLPHYYTPSRSWTPPEPRECWDNMIFVTSWHLFPQTCLEILSTRVMWYGPDPFINPNNLREPFVVILFFDYLLTLDLEVARIWSRLQFNALVILFLLVRSAFIQWEWGYWMVWICRIGTSRLSVTGSSFTVKHLKNFVCVAMGQSDTSIP